MFPFQYKAKLTKISHYTIVIFHLFFPLSDTASNLLQEWMLQ